MFCAFQAEEPTVIEFLFPLKVIRNCDQGTLEPFYEGKQTELHFSTKTCFLVLFNLSPGSSLNQEIQFILP